MTRVGVIKEIWRFPVKSMFGESVESAKIVGKGIPEDRNWALRDDETGIILGGKRVPKIMTLSARYVDNPQTGFEATADSPVEILFPDGKAMRSDDPYISAALSKYLGKRVSLHPRYPETHAKHYKTDRKMTVEETRHYLGMRADGPNPDLSDFPFSMLDMLFKYVTPPGTYYDAYPIHFITTASLEHMKACYDGDFRVERYRPSFLIETDSGITGLAEFDWTGRNIRVGDTEIRCVHRSIRCSQPGAEQPGGIKKDPKIPIAVMQHAEQNLGAYATVRKTGTIKVGDPVELLPESIARRVPLLSNVKRTSKSFVMSHMIKIAEVTQKKPVKLAGGTLPKGFEQFRLVKKVKETEDVTSFYLEPVDKDNLIRFVPGQHLVVGLPCGDTGRNIYRPYSLSCSAEGLEHYRITVKRETAIIGETAFKGEGSFYLHYRCKVGSIIHAKGPSGNFGELPGYDTPLVLMCNGIGITPFISLIKTLAEVNPTRLVHLFYGGRSLSEMAFLNELKSAKDTMPNLALYLHLSQPADESDLKEPDVFFGRISAARVTETVGNSAKYLYLLCGSNAFTDDLSGDLRGAGVSADRIQCETFAQKRRQSGAGNDKQYSIRFSRSDVDFVWEGQRENLLTFAEEQGMDVSSGCRYGACHACECTLVSGEVEYLGDIESPAGNGRILLCSTQPKSDIVLDL